MTRLISWLIMIPLAIVVVTFTVANRGTVSVDLWPTPLIIDVPVFSLGLAGGFTGFLIGALIVWLSGGRRRAYNRRLVRQLETAKREEAALRNRLERLEGTPPVPQKNLLAAPTHSRADAA